MSAWHWEDAPPKERADFVRAHAQPGQDRKTRALKRNELCDAFNLTRDGLHAILRGADWHPSFQRAKNE
jgi:hypothetical protein